MMKPSPLPKTSPAGSEWKVTVRSGVVEESLKGLVPPMYRPRMRVVTSSPSVMVNMSLSLMFSLRTARQRGYQFRATCPVASTADRVGDELSSEAKRCTRPPGQSV